jgi:iron(III) transport system permease protein
MIAEAVATYRDDDEEDATDVGLSLLAAALAAVLVLPVGWLAMDVLGLGGRALNLASSPTTLVVLARTVALVGVVTAGSLLVGVPLAVLTTQTDLPFARSLTVLAALPLAIPSYLGAFAATSATRPRGVLTETLAPLGLSVPEVAGFWGAAAVLTLYTYPYVFLTTRASLRSLDATLLEAARTLDCSPVAALRRVALPRVAPGVAAGSLLVALYALADFGTPNVMRVPVFTQFIYARYNAFMREYAALLSLQLLVVTVVVLAVESRVGSDDARSYATSGGADGVEFSLGRWRYPAALVPLAVGGLAVALPVGVFALWLTRGGTGYTAGGVSFAPVYGLNSLLAAGLAAVAAVVVAVPVAYAAARSDSRLAALADRFTYLGYATPGIVLAIALLSMTLGVAPWLYKTLPLLVFAYVVRFAPQAVGTVRTSVLQVDRDYVAAARTLGRGPVGAFRSVTLPLVAPGVAAGAALVFLTSMKELPATLLLRPLGFETLVTYIWRVQELGAYDQAAVPALVLVVVSGLSMAVVLWGENR